MIKYFCLLVFSALFVYADEYPLIYKQLSHPLYKSSHAITKLVNKELSLSYTKAIDEALALGFDVDKTRDSKKTKEYLFTLRKLQKKYDALLYSIHKEISKSIDSNDYERFEELTHCEFDGLLQSRTLYTKALEFYKKQNKQKKNNFFETRIKYTKLGLATAQEFQDEVITSTYDSTKKQGQKKKVVNLEVIDSGEYLDVYIENSNPYTVSVNVKGQYENLHSSRSNTDVIAVKAGQKIKYLRLTKVKGAISYSYRFSYTWLLGSISAIHNDDYVYRFPYLEASSHRVSQGFNGTTTHSGRSKYAIDFAMDIGTKIYAARGGVVVKVKENSNKGGFVRKFSKHGNYVIVEHDDSTFATYYHLKQNGAVVKVGDKISKGTFIAYSGNTGYTSGPHLHFSVFKASNATSTQTIKIKFLSEKGIEHYIEKGIFYTAK